LLVGRSATDARHEALPDASLPLCRKPSRIGPIVPSTQHPDALGVGGPHRETRSGHAVLFIQVCAELLIGAAVCALTEQVKVQLSESRINCHLFPRPESLRARLWVWVTKWVDCSFRSRSRRSLFRCRRTTVTCLYPRFVWV